MLITNLDKRKQYYQALLAKDQGYIGIFYAGVKQLRYFVLQLVGQRNQNMKM